MLRTIRFACLASVLTFVPLAAASADTLHVVASFSIIADFAKNVGGDRVEVATLVGPDGDAHVYEPKPSDAASVAGADVFLVNGLHFEGFLTRLVEASGTKAAVVELTKGIASIQLKEQHDGEGSADASEPDGHHHGDADPHAFQSIANARIYVKNIADAFCAADAAGCDVYTSNAQRYSRQLEAEEAELKAAIASIPGDKRVIITSHDAFGYFENAYGVTFLAPEGISTESEASAADVAALVNQVREDKASAIFIENITNPRLIEQIASETGIKVGGILYSDALSDPTGPASTYIDMMRHNANTIKGAITGS